jgi:hypothetical protein
MPPIDYAAPAELYARRQAGPKKQLFYRRFPSVAEALQFAVEDLPAKTTNILLETADERFEGASLKEMYEADGYPLARAGEPSPDKP